MSRKNGLPVGWELSTLDDIAIWGSGGTPKRSVNQYYDGGSIPWVTIADLNNGVVEDTLTHITELGLNESSAKIVPKDSILLALYGSIGKLGIAGRDLATNQAIATAIPKNDWFETKYLYYFLESQKQNLNQLGSGVTQKNIYLKDLKSVQIPVAPRQEQKRIAEKLDELFSELEAGVKELNTAQIKLKHYRQSLLKSAVEGALTQKWRDDNKHQIEETGKELLNRILIARKQRWEQEKLAEFKEKGKTPPKNWQEKYPEPVQPDTTDLPELPEGWGWASLDMIIFKIEAGKSFKCIERPPVYDEYGVVKVSAVTWGDYNELESKTCTRPELENDKILIKEGDFLFSRANTTELVGACVIANNISKKVMLSDKILRLRFVEDSLKYWIMQFMRGELGRRQIENAATGNQASMKNVSQSKLLKFAVPIPSLNEIDEIKGNLLTAFEYNEKATVEASTALNILNAQRKNILKTAFSGQLIPQDDNDQPATVLLEKIKREREEISKLRKPKQSKKVSSTKKITVKNLTNWLSQTSANSFTFEEIQKEFQSDYDQLKECLFELLSQKKPPIKQIFDQEAHAIKFVKED